MKSLLVFCFLAVAVKLAHSHPPEECKGLHKISPMQCCEMPPLAAEEDFKSCGFGEEPDSKEDGGDKRMKCDREQCLMTKLNALNGDKVDREALKTHLDKMAETDAGLGEFVGGAKAECLDKEITRGPPGLCEPKKILHCLNFYTIANCPKWKSDETCANIKERHDKCREAHQKMKH